ncbi:MAG: hypothetical protein Q9190_006781 [Brigantiaea leucoxantha]
MSEPKLLSASQICDHNTAKDLWIVVDGQVWDLTDFAPEHPGGIGIILQYAGCDASAAYNEVHSPSLLNKTLTSSKLVGTLDTSAVDPSWSKPRPQESPKVQLEHSRPPLSTLISSHDFETVASKTLTPKAWAFYSSAATDLVTARANKNMYDRIWFRPRVLQDVKKVGTRCRIGGMNSSLPFFVAPAAMARLVHPEGEKGIARGCSEKGIIQCISTNASFSAEEIVEAAPSNPFFFQLYVNKSRKSSEDLLKKVWDLGIRTIFLTVDAPVAGKREADERVKADETLSSPMSGGKAINDKRGGGLGRVMGSFIDPSLNWEDLKWLRRQWRGRVVLKGVMGAEDAKRAAREGIDGLVLRLEIYVDGGIRRGTDILKAMCLGATAVSIGRSFLYALNYGQEGVEHLIDSKIMPPSVTRRLRLTLGSNLVLRDELEGAMALVGITDLLQVHPGLVNTGDVDHMVPDTEGHPYAKWSPRAKM